MMYKIFKKFILIIAFVPIFSFSQDFDQEFLESLPEDVRNDLLDQVEKKRSDEEIQYRRESTFIPKEEDIEEEDEVFRFGTEVFKLMQTTLMPINEPNFDGKYILDFGDVVEIQLVGQRSLIEELKVERDGSISISELGKVFISGLSLADASALIKAKVNDSYIGVEAFVTLVNVRDIQVIVAGNVFSPGPYSLNGNSNIFHALSVSGGPSEFGSFREIKLLRDGEVLEVIDLYDTFIYGKPSFGTRLRSGDLVFVSPSINIASVTGAVKRPGIYELKNDENFSDLVFFANGLTSEADLKDIKRERVQDGSIVIKLIKDLEEFTSISVKDNDKFFIRRYPFRTVEIKGSVSNPGVYTLQEGDGILELLNRAGGYTKNAYPFAGVLENQKTKEINQEIIDDVYSSLMSSLLTQSAGLIGSEDTTGFFSFMLNELKNTEASGRVNAEFDIEKLRNNPEMDIILQDGDVITIPEITNQVYVFGEVSTTGTIRYAENEKYDFYIDAKGGFNSFADKKNVYILSPDGTSFKVKRNIFMNQGSDFKIYPGSVIYVPRKMNNSFFFTQTAQAYASILGNIGVSLASISVLKD